MKILFYIISLFLSILKGTNIFDSIHSEMNDIRKIINSNATSPLTTPLYVNTNINYIGLNIPIFPSNDLLMVANDPEPVPGHISNYFYSYEGVRKLLDSYYHRTLATLEDINKKKSENIIAKDPNVNSEIESYLEKINLSVDFVWRYSKAFEKCIHIISGIRKSRFATINQFYAKTIQLKNFYIKDRTSWTPVDNSMFKKHRFLKDHEDYETKKSPLYHGFIFYRRKSNPECVLMAHISSKIFQGFKFGNCVTVNSGTMIFDNVTIGDGTVIGHNCIVDSNTKIGNYCILEQYIKIGEYVLIGDYNFFMYGVIIAKRTTHGNVKVNDSRVHSYIQKCEEGFKDYTQTENSDIKNTTFFRCLIGNGNIFDKASTVQSFSQIMNNNYFGEFTHVFSFTTIQFYNFFHRHNNIFSFSKIANNNIFHANTRVRKYMVINDFTIKGEPIEENNNYF